MKTTKTVAALALAACLMGGASARADYDPAKKLDKMKAELSLTDEQTAQVKAIFDRKKSEMEAERKAWEARREATHEEIKALLNDDQKKKFDEMKTKMKDKHGKHGKKGGDCDRECCKNADEKKAE